MLYSHGHKLSLLKHAMRFLLCTQSYFDKHLMVSREQLIFFPQNINVSREEIDGNIEIQEKNLTRFLEDHSLSDLLYSTQKENIK